MISTPHTNKSPTDAAGFVDLDERHRQLEKLGDPLPRLAEVVDWEGFRRLLEKVHQKERKSNAGRKPFDVVLMFRVLVLQHLYNLADDQAEYQIRDRYSFCRFLGLSPEGRVPDAKTIWLFRERLRTLELVEALFAAQTAMGGMLVRTIGIARARVKIGMMNIVYNLCRWAYLQARCA